MFKSLAGLALLAVASPGHSQGARAPDTIAVQSGGTTLRALLWRPSGKGPFAGILFNHGSGRPRADVARLDPADPQVGILGPVFAAHGYVFLYLFRRGVGLSADRGLNATELMDSAAAAGGSDARNAEQLEVLEGRDLTDAFAALAVLRARPEVKPHDVAVVGHSFGGALSLLMAQRDSTLRAAVDFAGGAASWERSPPLRERLLAAARATRVPVFVIQAANDYSTEPAQALGALQRAKIYPPVGRTAEDGHAFIYSSVAIWQGDVFAFLRERM